MASPRDLYDAGAPAWRLPSAAGAAAEVLAMGVGGAAAWAAASGGTTTTVAQTIPFQAWQDAIGTVPLNLAGGGQVSQDLTVLVITTTLPSSGSPLTSIRVVIKPETYAIGALVADTNLGALSAAVPGLAAISSTRIAIGVQVGAVGVVGWVADMTAGNVRIRRAAALVPAAGVALVIGMGILQSISWAASPVEARAPVLRGESAEPALEESPPPAPTDDAPDDWDLSELGTPQASPEPQ